MADRAPMRTRTASNGRAGETATTDDILAMLDKTR